MRDYKGSGSFTLRERRRFPRGLLILILLIIAVAVAGFFLIGRFPNIGTSTGTNTPAAAKPSSGRDVIPLKIPGQAPEQNPAQGG